MAGSILSTAINNELAKQRERQAREENYQYGEAAAEQADARTRALYNDLYSPAAQMQQLKEAGLSPSIYASGGIAGKSGSSGAQGSGASGISPNVYGINALEMAQIANINADTNKKEAETGNIEEDTTIKRLQQDTIKIDNYIKDSTKDLFSQEMQAVIAQTLANTNRLVEETKGQELQNKWTEETWQTHKDQLEADLQNTLQDTALKTAQEILAQSNKELNDEQKKKIQAEVNKINKEIWAIAENLRIYEKSVDAQKEFWQKQAEYYTKQIEVAYKRIDADISISNQRTQTAFAEMNSALFQGKTFVRMLGIAMGNERFDNNFNPNIPIIKK